ncbi:MAG TPA: hypothetical protein VN934_10540 [Candidatus Tumulicola sp.]|nr:hypothetical protein [Candidatus Tumulicola sp.]
MPEVLICTASNWVGPARIPRLLHEAGCTVTVFGDPSSLVARSRYVSRRVPAPSNADACAEALREHLARQSREYAWVVVIDDPMLIALAKHAGEAWLDGWFPFDHRSDVLQCAISKNDFMRKAGEIGLPIPEFAICDTFTETASAARTLGYPVMLKLDQGFGGGDVWKATDESALRTAYDQRTDLRPFALQRFLDGPVGIVEALFDHGRLLCFQSMVKLETWPTPFSPSCTRRLFYPPHVEEVLRQTGELTGVHGFSGFDWILDARDQAFKIIEFHPRVTSGQHLSLRSGDVFSSAIAGMLAGCAPSEVRRVPMSPRAFKLFPHYLHKALTKRNISAILSWLPFVDRSWDTPWDDAPLMLAFAERLWQSVRAKGSAVTAVENKPRNNPRLVARRRENGDARREKGVVAVSTDSPKFNQTLTVGETFALHPGARAVFANFHLGGCSNCAISEFETIEQVSEGYGIPLSMIMDALNALPPVQTPEPAQRAS